MDEDFARMMMVLEMKSKDKTNNNEPVALVLQMPKGKGEKKKKKKGAETTLFPMSCTTCVIIACSLAMLYFRIFFPSQKKKT